MDLSAADRVTVEAIKQTCQDFGLKYSHHTYLDYLLSITFRVNKETMGFDSDFSIVLDTHYHSIALQCILPQPISRKKRRDLYEVLNQVNYKLANTKIVVQHPDPKVEIRGEMMLFGDPFKADNFKQVLGRFLIVSSVFVPLIDGFLKGQTNKDEVVGGVNALNNFQGFNSESRNRGPGDFPYKS